MWEEILKMLGSSGAAEGAIASGAMGDIAGQLAMKADPSGMQQVLGGAPQAAGAMPTDWSSIVNPNAAVPGNVGFGGAIPGAGPNIGADMMLTPLPQPAPAMPQVPNAPSWDSIVPPNASPAATSAAAALPPVTSTRPSVGLTPEQAMALMKGQQPAQEQRMPNAPATQGQPTRQVQFGQLQAGTSGGRPVSLGELLYRRR